MRNTFGFAVIAVVAAALGYLAYDRYLAASKTAAATAQLMALSLPDAAGAPQRVDQWRGKVLVVNFWATWCDPCREEMPALLKIQRRYAANGVQIVGIALDSADNVRRFAKDLGIDYPLLIGSLQMVDLTRALGDAAGGLPYTVVFDRSGNLVKSRLGGITEAELESAIRALLT